MVIHHHAPRGTLLGQLNSAPAAAGSAGSNNEAPVPNLPKILSIFSCSRSNNQAEAAAAGSNNQQQPIGAAGCNYLSSGQSCGRKKMIAKEI
jgi:hypothetical protein